MVQTAVFGVVIADYVVVQETMEEVSDTTHDEYRQRANGVLCTLDKFVSIFGLKFGHLLFGATKQFSRTFQAKDTTLQEATVADPPSSRHIMPGLIQNSSDFWMCA